MKLFTGADDRLRIKEIQPLAHDDFVMSATSQLIKYNDNTRAVVVYIHGFNTSFEEAAHVPHK